MFEFPKQNFEKTINYPRSRFLCLEFLSFGIVSDFVLRISKLACQIYDTVIVFNRFIEQRFQ